jgi:hypothetical protein
MNVWTVNPPGCGYERIDSPEIFSPIWWHSVEAGVSHGEGRTNRRGNCSIAPEFKRYAATKTTAGGSRVIRAFWAPRTCRALTAN